MLLIAIRKGGAACSCACPFYEESGIVRGLYNMPLKTHCRMVMNPWMVDCDKYDPMCIDKMEVSEEQFQQMQQAIGVKAIRQIKLYPETHEVNHPLGWSWTKGVHNATKSGRAIVGDRAYVKRRLRRKGVQPSNRQTKRNERKTEV